MTNIQMSELSYKVLDCIPARITPTSATTVTLVPRERRMRTILAEHFNLCSFWLMLVDVLERRWKTSGYGELA